MLADDIFSLVYKQLWLRDMRERDPDGDKKDLEKKPQQIGLGACKDWDACGERAHFTEHSMGQTQLARACVGNHVHYSFLQIIFDF